MEEPHRASRTSASDYEINILDYKTNTEALLKVEPRETRRMIPEVTEGANPEALEGWPIYPKLEMHCSFISNSEYQIKIWKC